MVSIPTTLKPEEVSLVAQALSQPGYEVARDMFVLALQTGMEASDLTNLRWSQIDLAAKVLNLESRGKSRTVPMSSAVYETLTRLSSQRSSETFVFGTIPDNVRVSVRKVWLMIAEQLGVPTFGLRSLRYTCLERMMNSGMDIAMVYAYAGLTSRNFGRKALGQPVPTDIKPDVLDRIWMLTASSESER